jgi:hypothetical protein
MSNPSYLPIAEQETDAFFETFKGKLSPEVIAEMSQALKQQGNVAAVTALTKIAPESVKRRLEGGEFNLSPEQRAQEIGRADAQIRALRAEKLAERQEAEFERRRTSDDARDEWTKEILMGRPVAMTTVVADQRLTPEHREHIAVFQENWMRAKLGQDRKPNPAAEQRLMLDIYAPEGDPRKIYTPDKIYEALKSDNPAVHINVDQFRRLNAEVANSRDPNNNPVSKRYGEAMNVISNAVRGDPRFAAQPELQAGVVMAWSAAVRDLMDEERKAGRNPARLFDPAHKDSVVTPSYIAPFITQARERRAEATAAAALAQMPAPKTQAEYAAVPVGALYVDTDGKTKVKRAP